jgi:hypothetical protein
MRPCGFLLASLVHDMSSFSETAQLCCSKTRRRAAKLRKQTAERHSERRVVTLPSVPAMHECTCVRGVHVCWKWNACNCHRTLQSIPILKQEMCNSHCLGWLLAGNWTHAFTITTSASHCLSYLEGSVSSDKSDLFAKTDDLSNSDETTSKFNPRFSANLYEPEMPTCTSAPLHLVPTTPQLWFRPSWRRRSYTFSVYKMMSQLYQNLDVSRSILVVNTSKFV